MVNKTSATSYPFTTFESPVKTAKTAQKESLQDALHYEGSSNQQKTLMSPARNVVTAARGVMGYMRVQQHVLPPSSRGRIHRFPDGRKPR